MPDGESGTWAFGPLGRRFSAGSVHSRHSSEMPNRLPLRPLLHQVHREQAREDLDPIDVAPQQRRQPVLTDADLFRDPQPVQQVARRLADPLVAVEVTRKIVGRICTSRRPRRSDADVADGL